MTGRAENLQVVDRRDACRAEAVPLIDLSNLLPDADWADSSHPNYAGEVRLHNEMMKPAVQHLLRCGLITPDQARRCILEADK